MKLTHQFICCADCGMELEVLDDDFQVGEIQCPECGYINYLDEGEIEYEFEERDF